MWETLAIPAHLKRDFQKLVERGGASTPLGQALLAQVEGLFHLWQRVRDGTLAHTEFPAATHPLRERVHTLLNEGVQCAHPQTQHFCFSN